MAIYPGTDELSMDILTKAVKGVFGTDSTADGYSYLISAEGPKGENDISTASVGEHMKNSGVAESIPENNESKSIIVGPTIKE